MRTNPRKSRGVAVIAVMIMFMLVAAAVVAMSLVFAQQARRTRAAVTGIQIRQLLLAAGPAARQELVAHGSAARQVPVVTPVAGAELTLDLSPDSGGRVRVIARAAYRADKGAQTLLFAPQGAADWRLVNAELGSVGN